MLLGLVRLVRPKQWSKNALILAAWLFAGRYNDPIATASVLMAFAAMCLASSAVYIANDLMDVENDRRHPEKSSRPIASGRVPKPVAIVLMLVLLGLAVTIAANLNRTSLNIVGGYLVMQVGYNLWAKRVPVLDVFVVAAGFVLRAVLGATAIDVRISAWLLFCTGSLALMLGCAKRRHEYRLQGENAELSRSSLVHYSAVSLDVLVAFFASLAAMSYGVYTIEGSNATKHPALIITAPFVLYGVARYLLLVYTRDEGGEPADVLFGDAHVLTSVVLFAVAAYFAVGGLTLPFLEP